MRKLGWSGFFRELPKMALFSFGIALCCLILVAMVSTFFTQLRQSFNADYSRLVFCCAFGLSIVGLFIRWLRSSRK